MLKHKLKGWLRESYARLLYHTGLHAVVDRVMPRRMTILFGHCVDAPEHNGFLPRDMKIRGENLHRILGWFGRRYELTTIGSGRAALESGASGRSLVALSMDDGYRDNRTVLQPLLDGLGAPCTVFLESRPLDERKVNWSHKYFWCLTKIDPDTFARRYMDVSEDGETREALRRCLEEGGDLAYQVKRILKYDADTADRDAAVDAVFRGQGGDETELCNALYMDWNDARELVEAGFELGGHTVNHVILARLEGDASRAEIGGCTESLKRELPGWQPTTFAYPFGRRWDYTKDSIAATREAGWSCAVNTHAGTVTRGADPMQLARLPIDDDAKLHLLVAEACGGFDLLRRVGVDLSE